MSTKTTKKLKDEETIIVLELKPREAAVIFDFVLTVSLNKGDFSKECREIKEALEDVGHEFSDIFAYMSDKNGIVESESFWFVDEANEDENLHSYSGA